MCNNTCARCKQQVQQRIKYWKVLVAFAGGLVITRLIASLKLADFRFGWSLYSVFWIWVGLLVGIFVGLGKWPRYRFLVIHGLIIGLFVGSLWWSIDHCMSDCISGFWQSCLFDGLHTFMWLWALIGFGIGRYLVPQPVLSETKSKPSSVRKTQEANRKTRYGALLAGFLLLTYVFTAFLMMGIGFQWFNAGSGMEAFGVVSDRVVLIHTTVAGLVSALVVSQLALTEPGKNPSSLMTPDETLNEEQLAVIVNTYLIVWALVGALSLLVGILATPDRSTTTDSIVLTRDEALSVLVNSGTNWLATAVVAAAAYLRVKPGQSGLGSGANAAQENQDEPSP